MEIQHTKLSDVDRYIKIHQDKELNEYKANFDEIVKWISKIKQIKSGMELLEVGVGLGWFQVFAYHALNLNCNALEISPDLIQLAHDYITKHNAKSNLNLENIENFNVKNKYDIIIADQVFEHVEHYEKGLENVYNALKPGGVFYFASNNKWSYKVMSGEFWLPFYDKLPDFVRYNIRILAQGKDIMQLGIDFNTFTNQKLRRIFKKLNYSIIADKIDLREASELNNPIKVKFLNLAKKSSSFKKIIETFVPGTYFICVK